MGLEQYLRAGANLTRNDIILQTTPSGSGSVELGSAYVLLSVSTTAPCRLRLYDNSQSLENSGEIHRAFGNTSVSASTALIGDFSMSAGGTYTVDPAMYSVIERPETKLTHYRLNNTQSGVYPTLTFTRYLLEDPMISSASRVTMPQITGSLLPGRLVSGTLTSAASVPRAYLLVSASVSGSSTRARLRLYTTNESLTNLTELSRSFATESANTSKLIVDAILSGSETTYFVPKIVGANLQTMGTNLNTIRRDPAAIIGNNQLYYVLQNPNTSGGAIPITASLHVFSLED